MITPCLWYNQKAEAAAKRYSQAFVNARISSRALMVVEMDLSGQKFILLDGGPMFTPNPSISFYYICETESELEQAWSSLNEKGKVLMPLDKYPWSEKYGWVEDEFGISWQLALGSISDVGQKITPVLLFSLERFGQAEKAIDFYCSLFKNSSIDGILRWTEEEGKDLAGKVKHAQIVLDGSKLMLMESPEHNFTFTEGISLTIYCDTQEEIDHFWNGFISGGGKESMCGWITDPFGAWWQVIPSRLPEIMRDPSRASKAMEAFCRMKKLDISAIEEAVQWVPTA